jgi:hypothetical protein
MLGTYETLRALCVPSVDILDRLSSTHLTFQPLVFRFLHCHCTEMAVDKRQLLAAFVVASVAGIVMLACRVANPNQDVEHYYKRKHKPLYYLMKLCYVVILAAAMFNARYIVMNVLQLGVSWLRRP